MEHVAGRVSFTSNDSNSYYYDMYFHQQSLYAALVAEVTPNYRILGQRRTSTIPAIGRTTASTG